MIPAGGRYGAVDRESNKIVSKHVNDLKEEKRIGTGIGRVIIRGEKECEIYLIEITGDGQNEKRRT